MLKKEVMLLVLSSALNAAICFGAFVTAGFATSPSMRDVSMRSRASDHGARMPINAAKTMPLST